MTGDQNCQTCVKMQVCKIYEQAVALKGEFDSRHGEISKLPMVPDALAVNCTQFIDIRKSESVNVEVAREFIFKELQLAKTKQDEQRTIEIHKVIRDMDEIKEAEALGV